MNRVAVVLVASIGVFAGSLLSDIAIGDGIQVEDIQQAAVVGLIAAAIQWRLSRNRR